MSMAKIRSELSRRHLDVYGRRETISNRLLEALRHPDADGDHSHDSPVHGAAEVVIVIDIAVVVTAARECCVQRCCPAEHAGDAAAAGVQQD